MSLRIVLCLFVWAVVAEASPDAGDEEIASDPDAPRVGASLDRTEARVGDRLTLTISAIASDPLLSSVTLPAELKLGKFELLDSSRSDRDLGDGNRSRRFVLQIATYETGEIELPPIDVSYRGSDGRTHTVRTTSIPVAINSLLTDEATADLQPPRPPRETMVEDRRIYRVLGWCGAAIGALLVGWATIVIVRRRRTRSVVTPPALVRSPEEIALERLATMRRTGLFEVEGYRPFFFEVAEVLRTYLGARLKFDSLELTTTELLTELQRQPLPERLFARIRGFLEVCDLVKFAKALSNDTEARDALDEAEAIVSLTFEAVVPPGVAPPAPEVAHG